jgi:hypothetical protein
MTSTLTIGPQQQRLEGRTVRDIVEYDPVQVNEVWCRKIFRQLLQSLELQYAMRMPHRAITPDTVVFHDNGEPLLIPSDIPVAETEQDEASDMAALARVVHYAITRELAPAGPLRGRMLEGYSDSLITAVDRCMASDPAERLRRIDEVRDILGIVSLGPAVPGNVATPPAAVRPVPAASLPVAAPASVAAPEAPVAAAAAASIKVAAPAAPVTEATPSFLREPAAAPASRPGRAGLSLWQRRAVAAGVAAVLLAVALALFAELRDSGSYDHIVLSLPQSGEQAGAGTLPAAPPPARPAASADAQLLPDQATASNVSVPQAPATAAPVAAAPAIAASAAAAPAGSATYRLQVQPWGVVYVDGVDRGVSPPVKRLVLTPGKHTIRITNPNFHDRVLEVDTAGGDGLIAADFNDEPRQARTNP